jgi:hypothetical protein
VGDNTIRIIPNIKFHEDTTIFKHFLINRVLKGLRERDVMSGKREPLMYEVITDSSGIVYEVVVRNFGGVKVLRELLSVMEWVLERV